MIQEVNALNHFTGDDSPRPGRGKFSALKVLSSIAGLDYDITLNPPYSVFGKVAITDYIRVPVDERLITNQYG